MAEKNLYSNDVIKIAVNNHFINKPKYMPQRISSNEYGVLFYFGKFHTEVDADVFLEKHELVVFFLTRKLCMFNIIEDGGLYIIEVSINYKDAIKLFADNLPRIHRIELLTKLCDILEI